MAINKTTKGEVKKSEGKFTMVAAGLPAAMASNALMVEDEFNPFYQTGTNGTSGQILKPPYDPRVLERLTQENNAIGACIDAMVVNVDGTGHTIERDKPDPDSDPDLEDDPGALKLESFFDEPFPGTSFQTMRRDLRRDLERIGYGFFEIMRNVKGNIVFIRNVPGRTIRMVKLDDAVPVNKVVQRNGAEVSYTVMVRERRYAQMMSGQLLYFKDFGATRDLDKKTGLWASASKPVAANNRASELMMFQVGQDPNSPYGVPRWEGQIPSILGSRSAEETNLVYLQSGGLPPALIIVTGGELAAEAKKSIERQFAPGQKLRVATLEVPSSSGSIDSAGAVKVSVERFGHERSGDSMFLAFDEKCFERILRSFRFSSMFVGGDSKGARTFAAVQVGYIIAEAQVFGPERGHFDEMITRKLLPALGGSGYVFKSKPISVKDVATQIAGLTLSATIPGADPESLLNAINDVTATDVMFSQKEIDKADTLATLQATPSPVAAQAGLPGKKPAGNLKGPVKGPVGAKPVAGKPTSPGKKTVMKPGIAKVGLKPGQKAPTSTVGPKGKSGAVKKTDVDEALLELETLQSNAVIGNLADNAIVAMRLAKTSELSDILIEVATYTPEWQEAFRHAVATRQFVNVSSDPEGLADIAGSVAALLKKED